jgi:hypothetical protein
MKYLRRNFDAIFNFGYNGIVKKNITVIAKLNTTL